MQVLNSIVKTTSTFTLKDGAKKSATILAVILVIAAIIFGTYAEAKGPLFLNPILSYLILGSGIITAIALLVLYKKDFFLRLIIARKNQVVKNEIDRICKDVLNSTGSYKSFKYTDNFEPKAPKGYAYKVGFYIRLSKTHLCNMQRHSTVAKEFVDEATSDHHQISIRSYAENRGSGRIVDVYLLKLVKEEVFVKKSKFNLE